MADSSTRARRAVPTALADRLDLLPVAFRGVAALFLFPSAILKLVAYGERAAVFAGLGVPAPGVTVVLVALLELASSALLVAGFEGRLGALVAVPVMVVAVALAGPVFSNVAVLVACLGVLSLGTGRYTLWDSEPDLLERALDRLGR